MGRLTRLVAIAAGFLALGGLLMAGYLAVVLGFVTIPALGWFLGAAGGATAEGSGSPRAAQVDVEKKAEIQREAEQVVQRIQNVVEDSVAFSLILTEAEINALVMSYLPSDAPVQDVRVRIETDQVKVDGSLRGRIAVPFNGAFTVDLIGGQVAVDVEQLSLGALPLPRAAMEQIQPFLDQAVDLNRALGEAGAVALQSVTLQRGRIVATGLRRTTDLLSEEAVLATREARSSMPPMEAPDPPGGDLVPPGSAAQKEGPELYLALGDSLAAGVGASRSTEGYVSRFHGYLERMEGREFGLRNLGLPGESTISMLRQGQLRRALEELRLRRSDDDPASRVSYVTIDLGANDLLAHLGSATCQRDPLGEVCQARLDAAQAAFEPNFKRILSELAEAIEPGATLTVMTVYNPFDFGLETAFEAVAAERLANLNTVIVSVGRAHGAVIADAAALMEGKAALWTHILEGDVHPTTAGYQALAYSLTQAR